MAIKALYVTSTTTEAEALSRVAVYDASSGKYHAGNVELSILISRVGSISTAWSLMKHFGIYGKPDFAMNAGIAGSFSPDFPVGSVVMPVSDCFADEGIENGNEFLTLFEAGLSEPDAFPFEKGLLKAPENTVKLYNGLLMPVKAITVNTATGSQSTKNRLMAKYSPDIETMEGAAFFYICRREDIPFVSVRAISNMVEKRDKSKWDIPLAISSMAEKLHELFKILNTL